MRNSPFEIFRRNQKIAMVVLTGLAMFSFIFLDTISMRSDRTPSSLIVALVALICGGGLWMLGAPRGKGSEWGLWGAVVGAVLGFIAVRNQANGDVVQTSVASYSQSDLDEMKQRRAAANQFAFRAKARDQGFGPVDNQSLVARALLLSEAKKYGITVSDEGVNDYIRRATQNRLPKDEFKKILRDIGLPETELFNILREELVLRLMAEMDAPARPRFSYGSVQTPLSYWKQFEMLQAKTALDAIEIPVAAFVADVPEPKDEELISFFNEFKNQLPTGDGRPGFLRDRQVQLAYLSTDFEAFEKLVPEPTDSEVEEYYAKNKERYRIRETPDFPGRELPVIESREPASALSPGNVSTTPEQPPPPDLPEPGACGSEEPAAEQKDTAQPAEPKAESEIKIPLTPPQTPRLQLGPDLDIPPTPGTAAAPAAPEPRYRELDDALKLEIRESMLRERAFTKMGETTDRALEEMVKLADEHLSAFEEAARAALVAKFPARLQAFAAENHLTYTETKPMTQQELTANLDEPIGLATEPSADFRSRGQSVAREVFSNDSLYYPRRANSIFGDKTYAYWKTADIPSKVPDFADVKTQVAEAWKFFQARPRAQKRAEELAELVQTSNKPITEALSGQTITGKDDSPAVVVKTTPPFSWLSMPRNLPFQFNQGFTPPTISVVDGVRQPGDAFMKKVFEDLKVGDTGVAPNGPRSDFYVVHVRERDTEKNPDGDNLALRALQDRFLLEGSTGFFNPAYMMLSQTSQAEIDSNWRTNFEKRYNIVWNEPEADQGKRLEP
jgi:hypothetical protein